MVKKSKLPVSSKMRTRIPCSKPHSGSLAGQPGSAFTFTSEDGCGILSRMVHCDAVVGTWKTVDRIVTEEDAAPGIVVQRSDEVRKHRREELAEGADGGPRIDARAGDHQTVVEAVRADAQPLLHVGRFRLRLVRNPAPG